VLKKKEKSVEKSPEGKTDEKVKKNEKNKETFPKNINEYRHIIDTFKVTDKDLEWVLELRSHKAMPDPIEKNINPQPFNFSSSGDYTYTKKNNWDPTYRGLSTNLEHLMRKRIGEQANGSQLEFETTLREGHDTAGVKTAKHPSKWNGTSMKPVTNYIETFLPPLMKSSIRNLASVDKTVARPWDVKISFDNENQKYMKSYEKSKLNTLAFIGEHLNMKPYNWKYQNSNVNGIRHILGQTSSNNVARWSVGLRDSYNDNHAGSDFKSDIANLRKRNKNHIEEKDKKGRI